MTESRVYTAKYRERLKQKGWVPVCVWVPKSVKEELLAVVQKLRRG